MCYNLEDFYRFNLEKYRRLLPLSRSFRERSYRRRQIKDYQYLLTTLLN